MQWSITTQVLNQINWFLKTLGIICLKLIYPENYTKLHIFGNPLFGVKWTWINQLRSDYVQITFRLRSNYVQLRSSCTNLAQKLRKIFWIFWVFLGAFGFLQKFIKILETKAFSGVSRCIFSLQCLDRGMIHGNFIYNPSNDDASKWKMVSRSKCWM